jgi:predicted nucleic acid-binding protein
VTPWLVDASVLLAAEDADDVNHDAAVELLEAAHPLLTLDLAFYEVSNVAVRAWHDHEAAGRLRSRVAAIADEGGVIRAEPSLLERAERIAAHHAIAVYDAAYVAAADASSARLVSCDIRDLVSRGLAVLPADARVATKTDQPQSRAHDDTKPVAGPTPPDAEAASTARDADEGGTRA